MHAAKCPNKQCDYPVQLPWREDIELVIRDEDNEANNKKPNQNGHKNGHSSNHENGHTSTNGHSNGITNGFKSLTLEELDSDDDEDCHQCPKCSTEIKDEFVKTFQEVMNFTYMHLQNMRDKSTTCILFER